MGQRRAPGLVQIVSAHLVRRCASPREVGNVLPPHRQYQLSVNDRSELHAVPAAGSALQPGPASIDDAGRATALFLDRLGSAVLRLGSLVPRQTTYAATFAFAAGDEPGNWIGIFQRAC